MIRRLVKKQVLAGLHRQAAVALLGPRQVGKTTLAMDIGRECPSVYLDLESPTDRQKLQDPEAYLAGYQDRLVILDEVHRVPELFGSLRGLIDRGRREGHGTGRFLLLGSASIEMMRQTESLAGRITFVEMEPLLIREMAPGEARARLWNRGGFPGSYLAAGDEDSFRFRQDFIRTYLERDIPMFGPRIAAETLSRFWTMLAHGQGSLLNASRLASGLGVSAKTVTSYLDLMVDLLLVRRLPSLQANVGKRLVKSPKVYLRDSGLVHALLGIHDREQLLGHPVVGGSWEGFVLENLLASCPQGSQASFYRTAQGAELDLVLELGGKQGIWAIEIKHSGDPKTSRGMHQALADLKPQRAFVVYDGEERYPMAPGLEAIGLRELCEDLAQSR